MNAGIVPSPFMQAERLWPGRVAWVLDSACPHQPSTPLASQHNPHQGIHNKQEALLFVRKR